MLEKINTLFSKRWLTWVLIGAVSALFFVEYNKNFDKKLDLNGDNMYYFMLSQSLADGKGYVNQFGVEQVPHQHFPPGYPAFMSVLHRAGIHSTDAMKRTNGVLMCLSIMLLMLIVRQITDNKLILMTAVGMLTAFHAELLRWATIMMSEMLYMFLTLLLIYLFMQVKPKIIFSRKGYRQWLLLFSILLISCYLWFVRTMGTSMLIAMILAAVVVGIYLFVKNKDKQELCGWLLVALVVAVGYLTAKTTWDARQHRVNPEYTSDYQQDFKKKPNGDTMQTFSDWTERATRNFKSYITFYLSDSIFERTDKPSDTPSVGAWVVGILLMLLIIFGCVAMAQNGILILFYIGVTFGVLLIWPEQYGGIRYFLTLIPLLLFAFMNGLESVCQKVLSKLKVGDKLFFIPPILVVLIMFILVPRYVDAQTENRRLAKVQSWQKLNNPPMNQYLAAAQWCGKNLNADDLVVCRKPEIYYMYSQYHHAIGFPQYANVAEVMNLFEEKNADYVLIDCWYRHAYTTLYPAIVENQSRFILVHQWGKYNPQKGLYPTLLFKCN